MSGSRRALRVGVWGATGYAGAGCVRLLMDHPNVELVALGSAASAGRRHADVCPGSTCHLLLTDEIDAAGCDAVISAAAPGEAAKRAADWLAQGAVVVDTSPDFRLQSAAEFSCWYGGPHPAAKLLEEAVLALPELRPELLQGAGLLALPGCFSTAVILACGPAARAHLVAPEVVADGKTGVSGAGRSASSDYLFSELNESASAYALEGHRHRPEMERALGELGGQPHSVTFVPHLVPMTRGLLVTCYLRLRQGVSLERVRQVYRECYQHQPFVAVADRPVPTKQASNTNHCWVSLAQQGQHLVASAVLDNLGRGASAQAVQVLNLRFGLEPGAGLRAVPQWP